MDFKLKGVKLDTGSDYYNAFMKETTGSEKRIMLAILKHMGKDTNLFCSGQQDKEAILEDADVSNQTFKNAMVRFRELCLIIPTGSKVRGEHQVNIFFAYKGNFSRVWNVGAEIEKRLSGMEHDRMYGPDDIDEKETTLKVADLAKIGAQAVKKKKNKFLYYGKR